MKLTAKQQKYKTSLIKRQHTICTRLGISDEERIQMLECNYGVSSSKDLHIDELKQWCESLEGAKVMSPTEVRNQKQRRKLFGLMRTICKHNGQTYDARKAETMAKRVCGGVNRLNDATEQQLIQGITKLSDIENDSWLDKTFRELFK